MKRILLGIAALSMTNMALAQDLPSNPEPGKCYVRCITPDVYKNVEEKVMTKAAYKKLVVHPAKYKTVTEKVVVKDGYKKLQIVPATFKYVEKEYTAKDASNKLKYHKATFKNNVVTVETAPAYSKWEMGEKIPNCTSADPNDCRTWCYKSYPAENKEVATKDLDKDAHTTSTPVDKIVKTYKVKVVDQPTTTKTIDVPAVYKTIKKTVLEKDAWTETIEVPAEYTTIKKEVLVTKGGLTKWEEVDCKLTQYNLLPINYDLNSAKLLPEAKKKIDELLLPILNDKKNVSVEIASHTDSRASDSYNQDLSERRARSVVNYLIQKGINPSRLVANGYGEKQLKNRCSNGVSCTEREHRENRRTEFRIISQGKK
ncbi:MAG: OmpA family protein [Flavobacteriales bacterium]|jgi:outer membrane protein OmpA-like peptidoglycan-associated protein|nr:OmpA family protein [Flavobacteriales bacterium]